MLGKILGGLGKVLIAAGLLVLGFVGYQLWGTGLETSRGQSELTEQLAIDVGDPAVDDADIDLDTLSDQLAKVDSQTAPPTAPPPEGEPVGIISIPKIGVGNVIVEGVSKADLKKGPGHYPGTPLPGQKGNSGIAGHRTTYGAPFNRIDELNPGDEIRIATPQGEFTYEVIPAPGQTTQAWYAVAPSDVGVLADVGDNRITLTACHPKYSARQRIIVHAVLSTPPAAAADVPVDRAEPVEQAAVTAEEFDEGLQGESSALPKVLMFGAAAIALVALAWFLGRHFRTWAVYLVAAPGVLVLVWFGYVYMDRYLPAL
ncbi:MAG: class E sortase [Actinomycetota bacterium]|nr:class E sortase [Actinomycetota bacterium]